MLHWHGGGGGGGGGGRVSVKFLTSGKILKINQIYRHKKFPSLGRILSSNAPCKASKRCKKVRF